MGHHLPSFGSVLGNFIHATGHQVDFGMHAFKAIGQKLERDFVFPLRTNQHDLS